MQQKRGDDNPRMENQEVNSGLHDRIRQRLGALDMTPEAASKKAGLDKTYLRKLFERPGSSPRTDTLGAIAKALDTTVERLMNPQEPAAAGAPSPGDTITQEELHIVTDVRNAGIEAPAIRQLPTDVPVMGTAAGSHASGAFQFEGGVIEYVRRPPAMFGVKNLYALYVEGTSMEPEHRPSDLRFIHPDKPPRLGDSVVVQVQKHPNDQIEATIGHLVKRTEASIFIGKLNPPATVEIKRAYVKAIHKVLTLNDLFGV
mgnify:FL=1